MVDLNSLKSITHSLNHPPTQTTLNETGPVRELRYSEDAAARTQRRGADPRGEHPPAPRPHAQLFGGAANANQDRQAFPGASFCVRLRVLRACLRDFACFRGFCGLCGLAFYCGILRVFCGLCGLAFVSIFFVVCIIKNGRFCVGRSSRGYGLPSEYVVFFLYLFPALFQSDETYQPRCPPAPRCQIPFCFSSCQYWLFVTDYFLRCLA